MTRSRRTASTSPAQRITAAIIEKLEQGTKPWVKPWRGVPVSRPLRSCGTPYRGMNTFWLWMVADGCGFASPYWMTYRQCQKLGGQVRKGEKSTIAIFYKSYTKEVENAEGEADTENCRVLKAYAVFNADQCDGLPEFYHPKPLVAALEPEGREDRLDAFFAVIEQAKGNHGAGWIADGTSHLTAPQAASARSMSVSLSLDRWPPSSSNRLAASSALAAAVRIARSSELRIWSQDAM